MPDRLHRYYGAGYSHFITTSCDQRLRASGYRFYRLDEPGLVRVNRGWGKIPFEPRVA